MNTGAHPNEPASASSSLLLRLKAHDPQAWERLVRLYGPVVYSWCRRAGLLAEDAADVGQEVFQAVSMGIDRFRRDRPGDSFRGWLWTVTRSKLHDHWRRRASQPTAAGGTDAQRRLAQVTESESADSPGEDSPDRSLFHRALELIRIEFEERTWQAFWRITVEDQAPSDVAAALGMSLGAVYVAKSRVLHRLREEFDGLLE